MRNFGRESAASMRLSVSRLPKPRARRPCSMELILLFCRGCIVSFGAVSRIRCQCLKHLFRALSLSLTMQNRMMFALCASSLRAPVLNIIGCGLARGCCRNCSGLCQQTGMLSISAIQINIASGISCWFLPSSPACRLKLRSRMLSRVFLR